MPSKNTMSAKIRAAWKKSGMSMKWLADEAGLPYASVHSFLKADRDPYLSTAVRMCDVLGLKLVETKKKGR